LLLALAAPASATVNVFATIDKTKDITVLEHIIINKQIQVIARVVSTPTSVAEAAVIINQDNRANRACENCAEKIDNITNSITANSGIVVTNQAAGSNNNQGSSIAIAVDFGGGGETPPPPGDPGDTSFANAQASVEQQNGHPVLPLAELPGNFNTVPEPRCCDLGNHIDAVNLVFRNALITGSINSNTGVVHVNQSVGNNNNQANGLAIAVGLRPGGGVAIAEADLGQFNTCNVNLESNESNGNGLQVGINKDATITGSVNANTGVIGVNQTAGNMANQANVVAFAAAAPN
jgi:hypothetical protein